MKQLSRSPSHADSNIEPNAEPRTTVAVLGTLAEFHSEPIPYDLGALIELVSEIQPDLLCLDITEEQWRNQDFGGLPPEYRDALLPLAYGTDIVIVPIAGDSPPSEPNMPGLRGRLIASLRSWLARIQRGAPGPDAVNDGWRHDLANLLYTIALFLGGPECRRAWEEHTHHLIEAAYATVRRNPGDRILVVVNVRHCHHIRPALRNKPGVAVVHYNQL